MALIGGSSIREDMEEEERRTEDGSTIVGSAVDEDFEAEKEKLKDGPTIIGSDNK